MKYPDQLNIIERFLAPTPKYHRLIRLLGFIGAIAATCALFFAPMGTETRGLIKGLLGASIAAIGVSQTSVDEKKLNQNKKQDDYYY